MTSKHCGKKKTGHQFIGAGGGEGASNMGKGHTEQVRITMLELEVNLMRLYH